jgi:hypothetical protein
MPADGIREMENPSAVFQNPPRRHKPLNIVAMQRSYQRAFRAAAATPDCKPRDIAARIEIELEEKVRELTQNPIFQSRNVGFWEREFLDWF